MELIVAPPTAINVQNPITRFISGNVMARPDMAKGPTPWPMKMLSTILYSDVATDAMIAGSEYCTSRRPTELVPSDVGDDDGD